MGIIKAVFNAVGGGLADSWQEVLEADNMGAGTVFTKGVKVRAKDKRNNNKKGTEDTISNGSIIHVYDNQFMMLVDGGKVVDFTAEPGYYKVDNSAMPSLFAGQLGESVKETFRRVKYGGVPSTSQKAYFINLQEIKGIKFGTRTPVNYFDNFYNSELFLRACGHYSIKITDPLKFYAEVVPRNVDRLEFEDVGDQYLSEFMEALQAALNKMSVDGIRISHVVSKARELSQYMAAELDESFRNMRGFEIQSVGLASVSYDEESKKLINMRNQGAMLGDAAVREGYVQGAMARGFEAAGSNAGGSAQAFMGMGMMGSMGGFNAFSETNRAQMQQQQQQREQAASAGGWTCACGTQNQGNFCSGCGSKRPAAAAEWTCGCGARNSGNFCANCGAKKPQEEGWFCTECGTRNTGNFCANCGKKKS